MRAGHGGGGLGTSWLADPAGGRTVILLTQRAFTGPQDAEAHVEVRRAVFAG